MRPVGELTKSSRRPPPTGSSRWWPYLAVAALFWLVPGLVLLSRYQTLPDYNVSGQCEGIGFGCALSPKDTTGLVAILLYPLVVVAGLLIMGVIAATRRQRRWLMAITAMWEALLSFAWVATQGTTRQAFSIVMLVVGMGLILVLVRTLKRWEKEPSR